jgi:plasmid stabilization system protein ParE
VDTTLVGTQEPSQLGPDRGDVVCLNDRRRDQKRVGLAGEFTDAVEEAVEAIVRWPRSGSLVDGVPADLEVQRLPVMRFPYHVAYAVDDDQVRILAIAHDRQRPDYWPPRTDG